MREKNTNRFNSDLADPELNINELDNLFNIDRAQVPATTNQEISDLRKELDEAVENLDPDPDSILQDNIKRANRLLDLAETECTKGAMDARKLEVMAQLINSITQAASQIAGSSYNEQVLAQKAREYEFKEKQLTVKNAVKGGNNLTQNNIIISNREDLLKLIAETEDDVEEAEIEEE